MILAGCKGKNSQIEIKEKSKNTEYVHMSGLDSLDTDTSAYIHNNLPTPLKQEIDSVSREFFSYILSSYITPSGKDTLFSFVSFAHLLGTKKFYVDSSIDTLFAWKKSFNRREIVQYHHRKLDFIITYGFRAWYEGKNYEWLILRLMPFKKDETVYF